MNEINQKDLKMRHPHPSEPQDMYGNSIMSKMTLDNLNSLRAKSVRDMAYSRKHNLKDDFQYEWQKYLKYDAEIKRRLRYINAPIITRQQLKEVIKEIILEEQIPQSSYRTKHFSIKWNEPDIIKNAGKIFFNDKWFANAVFVSKDWNPKHANQWMLNRHTEAFNLEYPSISKYYGNSDEILQDLELWYSKNFVKESHGIFNNQVYNQTNCTGTSHGNSDDTNDVMFVRDPLNDPLLTDKLEEEFRFDDFDWMSNGQGFNKPTDVYVGSIYLGVIESKPDGYIIKAVSGPDRLHNIITKGKKNNFKTKNDAANTLYLTWKYLRTHQ